jgi:serine/threonine protein kinase
MRLESGNEVGPYRIVRRIGQGSMGVVYQARDAARARDVALKVMNAPGIGDEGARARFAREARAVAKLRHRNIVAVFDFSDEGDAPYLVMELLEGTSLAERLAHGPPLTLDAKLDVVIQLCEGLQFAHDQGVVHRDVKPANIRLLQDGAVKLLDFGIASITGATVTQPGAVVGSVAYMSPEQIQGLAVDGRADVFSAGVVLHELLAGRRPFESDTVTGVMLKVLHEPAPTLRTMAMGIPEDVVVAVETALQKDPVARYASAADFGTDLRLARYQARSAIASQDTSPGAIVLPAAKPHDTSPSSVAVPVAKPQDTSPGSVPLVRTPRTPAGTTETAETFRAIDPTAATEILGPAPAITESTGTTLVRFLRAASHDRRWQLGAAGVAAGIVLLLVVARAAFRGGAEGAFKLDIQSVPAGAAISIDSAPTGKTTPAIITSTTKPQRIRLSLTGFEAVDEALTNVSSDAPARLRYDLRRLVRVQSDPAGATVLVNGADTGLRTPAEVPVPAGGQAKIELQLADHVQKEPMTPEMLASGNVRVALTRLARTTGAAGQSARVKLHVTGDYDFALGGSCMPSGTVAAREHAIDIMAPCVLNLRAPRYLLDMNQKVGASTREVRAPALILVDLRTKWEGCTLLLNNTSLGGSPARRQIAQGNYTATVQCQDRVYSTGRGALEIRPDRASEIQNGHHVWRLDGILINR